MSRLPGLDGLRAIAALCILLGHISQPDFAQWGSNDLQPLPLPDSCVILFLVLSGFLAGFNLKGAVSGPITQYYKKKAKRLLPTYYLYIAFCFALFLILGRCGDVLKPELLWYMIPMGNIPFCLSNGVLPLVHLWYIGVTVFFFLLFPVLARLSGDHISCVSACMAMGWMLLKFGLYASVGKTFAYRFVSTLSLDCIFWGVLIGFLFFKENHLVKSIADSRLIFILGWVLLLAMPLYSKYIPAPCRSDYMAVVSALLILGQIGQNPVLSLECGFTRILGRISYEIYVWQILVIIILSMAYDSLGLDIPGWAIFLIVSAVVIFVAWGMERLVNGMKTKDICLQQ